MDEHPARINEERTDVSDPNANVSVAPQSPTGPAVSVTVVGLGPMGRALASALLGAGAAVTVWNRTASKATELVARGARLAPSPADALRTGDLTVFCVLDDDVVASVIEDAAHVEPVDGATVVNLTADSPSRTRDLADRLASMGVTYLDGAIMTPAATIGTEAVRVLYSGARHVFDTYRDILAAFGGTAFYLGEDVAAAATYDVALLSLFWTSFAGVSQALAFAKAEGVDIADFAGHAEAMGQLIVDLLPGLATDYATEQFAGADSASIDSLAASLTHLGSAFSQAQTSTTILDAIGSVTAEAIDAGYGSDSPIRLAQTLAAVRPPTPAK